MGGGMFYCMSVVVCAVVLCVAWVCMHVHAYAMRGLVF